MLPVLLANYQLKQFNKMAELIKFVHEDSEIIIAELKADLETRLSRQVAPADIEMLLIQAFAYREQLVRVGLNESARQNMVRFSRGAALEYLGELVGVTRQPASGASCTILFNLIEGHNGIIIPEGLRIQSLDGKVIFQTIQSVVCAVGVLAASVLATASEVGIIGNGYLPGNIAIILDPQAFLLTAQNTDQSAGGSDEETDEKLKDRIRLAPASFSVAGPRDAYKFFAKSAHPSICDVAATSPVPGDIHIMPLIDGGLMPSAEILANILAICDAEKTRPLSDTVYAMAPTVFEYEIIVNLTLLITAVSAATLASVQKILNDYKEVRKNRLSLDVVRSQIVSLCKIDGVYDVDVISPAANIVALEGEYTKCTGITVNITGTHDE